MFMTYHLKKDIVFLYCDVRASQSMHENKHLWIAFRKSSKKQY